MEAFEQGHSRHFKDPFLFQKVPGPEYIRSAMLLNFQRVGPEFFLVALNTRRDRICGFSVVGQKRGLQTETFTQLLTAVRREFRDHGIYRGFTWLIKEKLPHKSVVLNATHAGNASMEAAYRRSGRIHLSDTVVLRFVFE